MSADDGRYRRLAALVQAIRADKRYSIDEFTNSSMNTEVPRLVVSVFGPVAVADVEDRLPAPPELNFRRSGPGFVSIADPDADPARRPALDVAVHFYPPLERGERASEGRRKAMIGSVTRVTPGRGLAPVQPAGGEAG